jgi:CubicO group peptidase (beta-lactamase class C family)
VSVNHSSFALLRACVLVLAAVLFSGPAGAVTQKPAAAPVAAAPLSPQMTPADIEAFLDGLVPFEIESADIAGMTIAIVKDGKLLFAKGYGFSDAEKRIPVSPETTLFRTGSVTKLFTWTAVMQLVEQGKLDLDTDVNTYLDFKLPAKFAKPVTLRNLMTHRGGFQETLKNLGAQKSGKVDLGDYVRNNIPDQIYEPGSTPSYSNYGASLAGYIVERVAGKPFDAYVEDNIFKPLGMTHSTLRQPLPKELEGDMSKGYVLGSDAPREFEIVNGYPAGSQSASAIDMTKFMLAHLNGGALGEARILKPETTALMHDTVTAYDKRLNGIALGFYEESRNGLRIIGHGGDTVFFHSDLHLIPSQNFGFFVSFNSAGRSPVPARAPLWGKFMDRYFPGALEEPKSATTGLTAKDVEGSYLSSRRADTSLLKLLTELGQPGVTANPDGSLTVDQFSGLNGKPKTWIPVGDGVFQSKHGSDRIIFVRNDKGGLNMLTGGSGVVIFEQASPLRSAPLLLAVLIISFGIVATNLIGWPIAIFVRRHYGVEQGWTFFENTLRLGSMAACGSVLTFVVGVAAVLGMNASESPWGLDGSLDEPLRVLQQVGHAGVALTFVHAYNTSQAWTNNIRGLGGRLKETAVLAGLAGLLWFGWTMNMFDPALRF